MATRRLELVFTGDTDALSRSFRRADREAGRLEGSIGRAGRTLGRFGAIAATALGTGFAVGAYKAVNAASDLDESINKAGATFERSAPEVEAWAGKAAQSMGLTKAAALEGASSIGAMLKPMGVAPAQAAQMSTRMTELAADMASFNNQDPSEMLERIRAGLSGESEPLKQFGAVLSETRVKQEAYRTGIAATGEELTEQQKIQARYSLLLRDTVDQHGDFARTSDGMANQTRILKANFGDLAADLGAVFLPAATKALQASNAFVEGFRTRWPAIKAAVAPTMISVMDGVQSVAGVIRRNWPEIRETTIRTFAAIRRAVQVAIAWIEANVVPTIRSIVTNARRFWARFGDDVERVFGLVMRQIRRAMIVVREIIAGVLAILRGDWGRAWQALRTIVTTALGGMLDSLRTLLRTAISVAGKLAEKLVRAIGRKIAGAGRAIVGGIAGALKGAASAGARMARKGAEWGKQLIDAIVEAIRSAPGRIAGALADALPDPGGGVPFIGGIATGGILRGPYTGRDNMFAAVASGERIVTPMAAARIPGGMAAIDAAILGTGGRYVGGFARGGIIDAARSKAVSNLGEPYGKPSRGESRTGPSSWDCSGYATYVAGVNVGGTTASAYSASSAVRDHSRYPIVWGFRKTHSGGYRGGYDEHMGVRVGGVWYQTSGGRTAQTGSDGDWQEIRVPRGLESLLGADGDGPGGERARGNPSLTPLQAITRLIGRSGLARDNTKAAGRIGRRILAASGASVTGISDRTLGASLSDREQRGVGAAGRRARAEAREDGLDPDAVVEAGAEAERQAETKALKLHVRAIDTKRRKLRARKRKLLADLAKLRRSSGARPGAKRALAARIRKALRTITAELRELLEIRAETMARLAELREEAAQEAYAEAYEAANGGDDGDEDPGPTADDYRDAALAQAALTEGLEDDLAAARAIETAAGHAYNAAVAGGDPRSIAQTARDLLAARQQREQIEATIANTEAVKANTEAQERFGGAVAFSSRGQDYVLRRLSAPSSDRLESIGSGV